MLDLLLFQKEITVFVVPKSTIEDTWIKTLHEMFPNVPINNLGGLQAPVVAKLKKERGEVKNWLKDGEMNVNPLMIKRIPA